MSKAVGFYPTRVVPPQGFPAVRVISLHDLLSQVYEKRQKTWIAQIMGWSDKQITTR